MTMTMSPARLAPWGLIALAAAVLDSAIYLLDGHAHFDTMDEVVNEDLLSHLYGTSIQVVHTPQGELYMRSV